MVVTGLDKNEALTHLEGMGRTFDDAYYLVNYAMATGESVTNGLKVQVLYDHKSETFSILAK